ncbi:MAG: homoserine dehydrogenase [Candidatus Pacebacteria bacterium]|nr:homoserine dehydrogenase [Candidatus Paceibacterota bacterium]
MNKEQTPLKIAIAGLGTVGGGLVTLLHQNQQIITARAGRPIKVVGVSARSRAKARSLDLSGMVWFDDPVTMAKTADADVIVELIGGSEGVARQVVEASLASGRSVVTANKALLATHGVALAKSAEAAGLALAAEAAVAGGIPIIKSLREGLAGNQIARLAGILNGTCNYILTQMRTTGGDFATILAEAQRLGYAESDPSFDIDGIDTAHKLALLAAIAFGVAPNLGSVYCEGIGRITPLDISFAEELGFHIKLLGIAEQSAAGIALRVHPTMVPMGNPIAHVEGVFNAVLATGDAVGMSFYQGRGAGASPTASAVVADLIDLARGRSVPLFSLPVAALQDRPAVAADRHLGSYYLRLMVRDQAGVIADISAILRDFSVSLESMIQRGRSTDAAVPLVMTTHETDEAAMMGALAKIAKIGAVLEKPQLIRIVKEL